MRRLSQTWALTLCLVFFSAAARAGDAHEQAIHIWDTIMSPYCPGRTLSACPSDDARTLREEILADLEQGKTPSEVREVLARRFGAAIDGEARLSGIGWLTWFVPISFLALGAAVVVRRVLRKESTGETSAHALSEDVKQKVVRQLRGA